jgi:membrane protein
MPKLIEHIHTGRKFLTENLWSIRIDKITNKRQGFLLNIVRILALSIKGFNEDRCLTRASALTYYILLSIVPILALAFAIAKGLGYEAYLQQQILADNMQYKDVLDNIFVYAHKLLDNTQSGLLALVGIIVLLWSVISLLSNIENTFNDIWNISKGRSWFRKITDYLTIFLIAPIFLLMSSSLLVLLETHFKSESHLLTSAGHWFIKLLAYFFMCLMFTVMYMVMPNIRVKFKSAFYAGIFATILFELLQWSYITFQIGAGKMNAIYGTFAALPLFLIFVQYSWYILLYGAEISYSIQNVSDFELAGEVKNLSIRYKRVMAILISSTVMKNFISGLKPMNAHEIGHKLDLPHKLTSSVISELVGARIFVEVKGRDDKDEVSYQPAVSDSQLSVRYLIDALDKQGINELPITIKEELKIVHHLMDDLDSVLDNAKGNLLIKDIK